MVGADEPCPLPSDPVLAEAAVAMADARHATWIVDDGWRLTYVTDDFRSMWGDRGGGRLGAVALGHHLFSAESLRVGASWRFGLTTDSLWAGLFRSIGGLLLADLDGDRDALRASVDPCLHDVVDELAPHTAETLAAPIDVAALGVTSRGMMVATRLRDRSGRPRGMSLLAKPMVPMEVLVGMSWERDLDHLERSERFMRAGRRPAAILFADLEASSQLIRTLPTASYFTVARRLVRAADRCVVEAGGIVGRHVGDGIAAFFPAETSGSESAAARACFAAAGALRDALHDVAERSGLDRLTMRFGLHWGSTVFIGRISTLARSEVTAMGDEVNEAARIEASATGGRMLASKLLVERLDPADAAAVGIDPEQVVYSQLADLGSATDKARRDAPSLAVCEI